MQKISVSIIVVFFFAIILANVSHAEAFFGLIVNNETKECIGSFLGDEYTPGYIYKNKNCFEIEGGYGTYEDFAKSINCTYLGCANNCGANDTAASVTQIGCSEKIFTKDSIMDTYLKENIINNYLKPIGFALLAILILVALFRKYWFHKKLKR